MYNFYLPNFYQQPFQNLNFQLIILLQQHPEFFYENIKISALYGNFPGVIWNGGRVMAGEAYITEIEKTITKFNNINIPLRFTYTNSLITEDHLSNVYANIITMLAHNNQNEILINSQLLENYLRQTYPNYKFCSSTTKCILDKKLFLEEQEKYYLTVLDYRYNKDFSFLNQINTDSCELLINPYCGIQCQHRLQHYENISKLQLNNIPQDEIPQGCVYHNSFFEALKNSESFIKIENLYSVYGKMGFQHFKIEGRCNSIIDVIESYIYYMVKPEYKNSIKYLLLKESIKC